MTLKIEKKVVFPFQIITVLQNIQKLLPQNLKTHQ